MKLKFTFIIALIAISNCSRAQCDPELYEKLSQTFPPYSLLKRFPATVKKVEGVPFSVEYTYVLTSEKVYGFYLEHSQASEEKVQFSLLNADGVDWTKLMQPANTGDGKLMTFECPATGIYHIIIYANQSFNGCAILQLSYLDKKPQPCDLILLQKSKRLNKNLTHLKEFSISSEESERTYVFTKGSSYRILLERADGKKEGVHFELLNADYKPMTQMIAKEETDLGVSYTFNSKVTGIYYFKASVEEKGACARVQILKIEPK